MISTVCRSLATLLPSLLLAASVQAGSLKVYLSAPFTQTATTSGTASTGGYANAVSEPFNGSTGSAPSFSSTALSVDTDTDLAITPATTFTAGSTGFTILANGQYGGGLQGNYLGVPSGIPTTLTLSQPVGYFGLEWCAVDSGNSLTVYDQNNALIGTFDAATFAAVLPNTAGTHITALNGTTYNTTSYFGQPTGTTTTSGRQNSSQQYAFLNFITDPGTKISKIVFNETGAVFESDNEAILTTAPTALGSFVFLGSVPEASSWSLSLLAAGGLMLFTFLRRRSA